MNKSKVTPKDFILWLAAMVALYISVYNYVALVWNYINYAFPDPLAYYSADPYQSGISWEMASLIVLVPIFLLLMWWIHSDIRRDATRAEIWVRRWALYLTLFVAGFSIAVDLIYVLYAFLNGTDITTRFLLKAFVVLAVAAIGFMHFLADLWGYWEKFPMRNRMVASATGLLVVITIIAGFFIVGTPAQARLYRFDAQKVSDLQILQSQIVNYWQSKEKLPATLSVLQDPISGFTMPIDPQTSQQYEYKTTGPMSFELCAVFNAPIQASAQNTNARPVPVTTPIGMNGKGAEFLDNQPWTHDTGRTCFERTIDPQRYPPFSKQKNLTTI